MKLRYRLRDVQQTPYWKVIEQASPDIAREARLACHRARLFGEKLVAPVALKLDQRVAQDPNYFPWEIVKKGCRYRFLSLMLPKAVGGLGLSTTAIAVFLEELCTFCPGVANIFGAHALGLSPMFFAPDLKNLFRYGRKVTEAEKKGEPLLFALAITEPEAGSDVEDADFLKTARLTTVARRVRGGFLLNGRKVFISNGSVARYIWVGAVLDRKQPLKTSLGLIVSSKARGFSVGRVERKMGQRACPAAELVFENLFVPTVDLVGEIGDGERMIAAVLGASRGPVGAIATGIARGALERLMAYLTEQKPDLLQEQWCQIKLVDLVAKVESARQMFLSATLLCDLAGLPKLMRLPLAKAIDRLPASLWKIVPLRKMMTQTRSYTLMKQLAQRLVKEEDLNRIATYSSLAKFHCSDIAMEVTGEAMEMMGSEGTVRKYGVEKLYRDAKLTQIYEGTNQINRIYAFKHGLL